MRFELILAEKTFPVSSGPRTDFLPPLSAREFTCLLQKSHHFAPLSRPLTEREMPLPAQMMMVIFIFLPTTLRRPTRVEACWRLLGQVRNNDKRRQRQQPQSEEGTAAAIGGHLKPPKRLEC